MRRNLSLYELVQCRVYNQEHTYLGTVSDILENGAHIILRITGEKNFLLPFKEAFVKEVDVPNKTIVIQDMEGLY